MTNSQFKMIKFLTENTGCIQRKNLLIEQDVVPFFLLLDYISSVRIAPYCPGSHKGIWQAIRIKFTILATYCKNTKEIYFRSYNSSRVTLNIKTMTNMDWGNLAVHQHFRCYSLISLM